MLRLAQAEDAMAAERVAVNVVEIGRKASEAQAPLAIARNVTIEFDASEQNLPTLGHPALVEVAIGNVVDNAIRHSPDGGTVSVAITAGPTVIVEDRGPGVPDDQKAEIFERFWRATAREHEGSGIGLALVRRIVQLHGGGVSVADRPGGGARFVLTFAPLRQVHVSLSR